MSANHRPRTFPTGRPATTSPSDSRRSSSTVEASSERGSIGSDETHTTSLADEAQTCYNILLILRTDTQHLISLRNENLAVLEDKSGLNDDAASSRTALLACINESIIAATRSITQLGPFLDRHRWPAAASRPTTPASQRRSFPISFKPRRRRRKSTSGLATGPDMAEDGESLFSADELFSWTLALTAQHTAVLVATERLCTFLESGIANVSEEERKRRDARASWWEQGRGEFENVGLIQSLLGKPKRTSGEVPLKEQEEKTAAATNPALADLQGNEETPQNLTPIMESDDTRSETLCSDEFTPSTLTSTPKGLTARPRHQPKGFQHQQQEQQELGSSVRRVYSDSLVASSTQAPRSTEPQLSRSETFGAEKSNSQLSPFGSSKPRPRITTSPLPSVISLQNALLGQVNTISGQGNERSGTTDFPKRGSLSAGGSRRYTEPTPPFTPNASPEKQDAFTTASSSHDEQERNLSPLSPGLDETEYTPYTPLDLRNTSLFTQRTPGTLPANRTVSQPLSRELLGNMFASLDQGAQNMALRVSPIEAKSRVSIAPMIEGPDIAIVSPVDTESGTVAQPLQGVSPITSSGTNLRELPDNVDGHVAWLAYMERKQQVCAGRWSLRRANTSDV
ncbi:hypothetical protein N0V82_001618 [Gnomoniopsis sp. IMI 355080]|nr:hypothetical protein N0V82_001618 [Gnomoniopsis sp. IMI 355080]